MSAFVDTNILVRHLTGDPAEMAARATAYLELEASFDRSLDRVGTIDRLEPPAR